MSARPPARFVIVPHRPRSRWRWLLAAAIWLGSVALAAWLAHRWSVPLLAESMDRLDELGDENLALQVKLEEALQQNAVLGRAEQVSRDALGQLQASLAEREEEIAALRADVGFYERLVGGSARRQGLTVHSVRFRPEEGGEWRYAVTLTQNLERSGLTRGELRLSIEGQRDGALATLDWPTLHQQDSTPGQAFEFRYFQQVEGSVMLPAGFVPQRVRVEVDRGGSKIDHTVPWEDTQKS
jgi:hypothetical protein